MEDFYKNLVITQENLSIEQLEKIYEPWMASHLWDKFIYYDRNLLTFINYLDSENRKLFFDAMNNDTFTDE